MTENITPKTAGLGLNLAQLQPRRASAAASEATKQTGRTVSDRVDLSQAGRQAQSFRDAKDLSGKELAAKLADSLEQGNIAVEAFAAKLRAGRGGAASTSASQDSYQSSLHSAVMDIISSGKPGNVIDGVISRLFKRQG